MPFRRPPASRPRLWRRQPGSCRTSSTDGDNDLDVVISEYNLNVIEWYENNSGSWVRHVIGSPRAHDIELADLDLDGDLDVVTRDQGPDGVRVVVWRHAGANVWQQRLVEGLEQGEGLTVGEINGDGRPDVVVPSGWFAPPSDLVAGAWVKQVFASGVYSQAVLKVADLDADGRSDIVFTPAEGQDATRWYRAPSDPVAGTWENRLIDVPVQFTHSLMVADFDSDGRLDVVTAEMHQSEGADEIRLYLSRNGAASWDVRVIATTGSHNMAAADFDGDGDLFGANWSGPYQPVELWVNLSVP